MKRTGAGCGCVEEKKGSGYDASSGRTGAGFGARGSANEYVTVVVLMIVRCRAGLSTEPASQVSMSRRSCACTESLFTSGSMRSNGTFTRRRCGAPVVPPI